MSQEASGPPYRGSVSIVWATALATYSYLSCLDVRVPHFCTEGIHERWYDKQDENEWVHQSPFSISTSWIASR